MDTSILNDITNAFVDALQSGQDALATYSIPLLAILAIIHFYTQIGPALASGGAHVGDAVAHALLIFLKAGIFYWLLVNLSSITNNALATFFQWGAASGGDASRATFLSPGAVLTTGFRIAKPIRDFTDNLLQWAALWKWPTLLTYSLSYYAILIAFTWIALHLMATIIEFYLAAMVAAVLVPWGVLRPTAFFSEFSVGWLTGGLVRVLVTTSLIGIALPLFDRVIPNMTGSGDPTFFSAILCGLVSIIFAVLSWVIPTRAAAIAGRGVSLAFSAADIIRGASSGTMHVFTFTRAIRGASGLLQGA